jgi:hypothetical protein
LTRCLKRSLSNLRPFQIALIGLALSIAISVLADRMIVTKLSFPLSLVPLVLIIGGGYAALGWQWRALLTNRSRLVRMLVVFAGMGALLGAVWLVDRGMLSVFSDCTHQVVYAVPGVYVESSPGVRYLSIESDVPPYWLFTLIYGGLAAAAGNFIRRVKGAAGG